MKSRARNVTAGGQWRDAVRSRLANAAERHGGAAAPKVRGEKTVLRARNSMSATD